MPWYSQSWVNIHKYVIWHIYILCVVTLKDLQNYWCSKFIKYHRDISISVMHENQE